MQRQVVLAADEFRRTGPHPVDVLAAFIQQHADMLWRAAHIARPGGLGDLYRGRGRHLDFQWASAGNNVAPLVMICNLFNVERARAARGSTAQEPRGFARMVFNMNVTAGTLNQYVLSNVHLWALLRFNTRRTWVEADVPVLLQSGW